MSIQSVSLLCLVALVSVLSVSCQNQVDREGNWIEAEAPLVHLEVYYETLCPDSRDFIEKQLYPTAKKVGSILDINVYPYGKANETKHKHEWNFKCQHGPKECATNILTTCALHLEGKHHRHHHRLSKKLLDFIYCIENSKDPSDHHIQKTCAHKSKFDFNKIKHCAETREGHELEHFVGLKTAALSPKLNWVPWIVLNGEHTSKIQAEAVSDLIKLVCDTYTGPRPKACPPKEDMEEDEEPEEEPEEDNEVDEEDDE